MKLPTSLTEAANRAEATALLIRKGYRVYSPEADFSGVDLIVRLPGTASFKPVQLKARPTVDRKRYGKKGILMLFPDPKGPIPGRTWYLIDHDRFFQWVSLRHSGSAKWSDLWYFPYVTKDLESFLRRYSII